MRCEVRDSHGRLTVLRGHGVHRLQQITATHNNSSTFPTEINTHKGSESEQQRAQITYSVHQAVSDSSPLNMTSESCAGKESTERDISRQILLSLMISDFYGSYLQPHLAWHNTALQLNMS